MFKDLFDFAKQVVSLAQDTRQNKAQIERLQRQVEDLTAIVQRLVFEVEHMQKNEAREREMLVLRLENALLRFERRLPPAGQGSGQQDTDVE